MCKLLLYFYLAVAQTLVYQHKLRLSIEWYISEL